MSNHGVDWEWVGLAAIVVAGAILVFSVVFSGCN